MKNAKIFLVDGKHKLKPMVETSYVTEDDLQVLLADYPDLLPGDQIDPEIPRRWLLVAREVGVPGSDEETGRWSLDHLFLDQEGTPTFVECKRSSDTRSRREVVAQMLDYAANGTSYWKMDSLRQAAAETAQKNGKSLDDEILELLDSDDPSQVEQFWINVEEKLKSANVRLIFVADSIPSELRRLVEFLNEQMTSVEVLAVEVKQFLGDDKVTAIVPRLLGMTETARETKRKPNRKTTNWEEMRSKCTKVTEQFFKFLLESADKKGYQIYWGTVGFSIRVYIQASDSMASIAYGYPSDQFQLYFGHLPYPEEITTALRNELLEFGIFKQSPKTLATKISIENIQVAKDAYNLMERKLAELAAN